MARNPRILPIVADITPVRLEPLVVVTAAAAAVVVVTAIAVAVVVVESKVVTASPPSRPPFSVDTEVIPPVNIDALADVVVDGAIDIDPGHWSGSEIVECVGAGKLYDITVG